MSAKGYMRCWVCRKFISPSGYPIGHYECVSCGVTWNKRSVRREPFDAGTMWAGGFVYYVDHAKEYVPCP